MRASLIEGGVSVHMCSPFSVVRRRRLLIQGKHEADLPQLNEAVRYIGTDCGSLRKPFILSAAMDAGGEKLALVISQGIFSAPRLSCNGSAALVRSLCLTRLALNPRRGPIMSTPSLGPRAPHRSV